MSKEEVKKETLKDKNELFTIVNEAIARSQKKVDQIEISLHKTTGIEVSSREKKIENLIFNHEGALNVTVYQNNKRGHASTNDLNPVAIDQTIDRAIAIMKLTSEDPYSGLADPSLLAYDSIDLDLFHPTNLNVDDAIEKTIEIERAALDFPAIRRSNGGHYNSHNHIFIYANNLGMINGYCSSRHSLSCGVVAEHHDKMVSDYDYSVARDFSELLSPQEVGERAARQAISHLDAQTINTMIVPVLFVPQVARELFSYLAKGINGHSIYKKSSFLLDQLDKIILPEWLSIEEKPLLKKAIASAPFDHQGVLTQNLNIVESGRLTTYLLDCYSAKKLSNKETHYQSNAHKGGIYNWILNSANLLSYEELLKKMGTGIVVTSLMGQGVNLVNGDYSKGAEGFWVENGTIQYPIHEFTIASNLKQMYQQIIAIGNDIDKRSGIQTGSILIDSMKIAGL